jgi:hypothetical protein
MFVELHMLRLDFLDTAEGNNLCEVHVCQSVCDLISATALLDEFYSNSIWDMSTKSYNYRLFRHYSSSRFFN